MIEYESYSRLLSSLAWKAAKRTGVDLREARSVANLAFAEARQSWNPSLGAFSTHLTHVFNRELYRSRGLPSWEELPPTLPDSHDPFAEADFRLRLERLSSEAKQVVGIVLNSPVELFDWTLRSVRTTKTNLIRYLTSVLGWERRRVNRVIGEIRDALAD